MKLCTEDLCSKWGFDDTDQISNYIFKIDPKLASSLSGEQKDMILITLIEKFMIPELKKNYKKVEYCKEGLIHNPIRLTKLDDIEIEWDIIKDYDLIPEYIIISKKEVLKIIAEIRNKKV